VLTGDIQNYFNFYVNNKLVMYIYLMFSTIIGNTILSIKILNFALIYTTCIVSTLLAQKLYVKSNKYITLFLATIFIPYGLLTIPYVYQITICITALVMYLYVLKGVYTKILAIILSSVLFILRPTTLISVLVLIFFYGIYEIINKKKYYIRFIHIGLILVVGIIIKFILGQALYLNKIVPYPNIASPTASWIQYVGTGYNINDLSETGRWLNAPDVYNDSDDLSKKLNELWNSNISYDEYKPKEKQINEGIWNRFKYNVLTDPFTIMSYNISKFSNLFNNSLSLYLYNPIIYNNDLMKELQYNYQDKYNLLHNAFIYIYIISTLIFLIVNIKKHNNRLCEFDKDTYINISLIASVFLISIIYIAILEVSKRYTLDLYIPMLILMSYQISFVLKKIEIKVKQIKFKRINTVLTLGIIISIFTCLVILNTTNNNAFKGAKYYITNGGKNEQILHIYFSELSKTDSLSFHNANNKKYIIKSNTWQDIPFYNNPKGGVALIMIYNNKKYIQIKQYSNIEN